MTRPTVAGRVGLLLALLAAETTGCRCEPEKMPSRSSRSSPEVPAKPDDTARVTGRPVELEAGMKRDLTQPCGECCSVREIATSGVSLAMLEDLSVQALDSGTITHVETTSGVQMQTSRTWSFHYDGSWRPDGSRRAVTLRLVSSSCSETFALSEPGGGASSEEDRDCPVVPPAMELVCLPGPVQTGETPGDGTVDGFVCGSVRPVTHPGTPLPWSMVPPSAP